MDLADLRKEYSDRGLSRSEMNPDPIVQFARWFDQATAAGIHEPNAMTLATADDGGMPCQRTVLLKGCNDGGFVFFTNYQSRKAAEMAGNPRVSLLFPWITLERQVIVQGVVDKIGSTESREYFATRPRESQIGAWVSDQSEIIPSREFLTQKLAAIRERFAEGEIPLPPFWGGYRVIPSQIEFWQGGAARLHDRFLYRLDVGEWRMERLSP